MMQLLFGKAQHVKLVLWIIVFIPILNCCNSTRYNYNYLHPKWMKENLKLKKPDLNRTALEIRVWERKYSTGETVLSLFRAQEDTEWEGWRISFISYNQNDFPETGWTKMSVDQRMSEFLDGLSWETFSDIPLQSDINEKVSECSGQVLLVADGNSFIFDFLSKRNKKRVEINNPEDFFEFYSKSECKNLSYDPLQSLFEGWKLASTQ